MKLTTSDVNLNAGLLYANGKSNNRLRYLPPDLIKSLQDLINDPLRQAALTSSHKDLIFYSSKEGPLYNTCSSYKGDYKQIFHFMDTNDIRLNIEGIKRVIKYLKEEFKQFKKNSYTKQMEYLILLLQDYISNEQLKKDSYLFPSNRNFGESLSKKAITNTIKKISKDAAITEVTCHNLRSTFAVHMCRYMNYDIDYVQDLLGHSDLNSTKGYIRNAKRDDSRVKLIDQHKKMGKTNP